MRRFDGTGAREGACWGRCILAVAAVALPLWGARVQAQTQAQTLQTLDNQYAYYLPGKCQNMGFARDESFNLLPGQAGPHLAAYCSGLPIVSGGQENNSTGGAAGAEDLSNQGGEEDRALQRRRKRLENDAGAADPADTELASFGATSVFSSLDYQHEHQIDTPYEAGRTASGFGGLLGADHRFGTQAVAGVALRYQGESGSIDSGGHFSTHTPGVRAYGSWVPVEGLFIDADVGFDRRDLDTTRIVGLQVITFGHGGPGVISYNPPLAAAVSSAREGVASGALQTGYDFRFGGLAIGPRVAVAVSHSVLDPYVESGDTPMTLAFDEQKRTSLRSLAGLQATQALNLRGWVLVPQLNVDYVHEYRDDQQLLTAHFAEDLRPDPTQLQFLNNPPDRDWFVFRLSAVASLPHGVSLFAAAEATSGNTYVQRYVVTLGARWEL
jgi:uncharacterized protein YhjY with autotransporter beta-barrel domain